MLNSFRKASLEFEQLNQTSASSVNTDVFGDAFSSSNLLFRQINRSYSVTEPLGDWIPQGSENGSEIASTLRGRLDRTDDINPTRRRTYKDDYLLNSSTGGQFRIDMNSSEFDTYLQIIDFNTGRVLANNDDYGSSTDSRITFTVEGGRKYIIRATSFESYETGAYRISAQQTTTPPGGEGFSRVYGYGLVDAAAAVAQSISQSRFSDVPNLGGVNWNNDMVNAPEVWARNFTGSGVTVAVIDSGVDITHRDLRDNIWVNSREVANDGIDNDRNGYVDDLFGWNFGVGQFNNNVMPGTDDPGQGHGTHVAGTIAALNNGFGMTGVAPNARIMALRLGDVSGNRFTNAGSLAQAVRYAVDNGARVINMSLGWSDSPELADALAYAASRNVITVSAAGNSAESSPGTPANYATRWGLSVGAVDRNRAIASFSNRAGSDERLHHIVAPGVDIYSTIPDGQYDSYQGTSMAAPHVAGVVALMLSANPNLTHDQVRRIITGSAFKLSSSSSFAAVSSDGSSVDVNEIIVSPPVEVNGNSNWHDSLPWLTSGETWGTKLPQTYLAVEMPDNENMPLREAMLPSPIATAAFPSVAWSREFDFTIVIPSEIQKLDSSGMEWKFSEDEFSEDELLSL